MELAAYHSLRDLQEVHWWFSGRRAIIEQLIRRFIKLPNKARILEAGCGYGGNLKLLEKFGDVSAFEFEQNARAYASELTGKCIEPGHLPNNIGFDNSQFELIAMLDVLEHVEDDSGSLREIRKRLASNGFLLITVPAMPWLWSKHDEIHHHKRRYTKSALNSLLQNAGYEIVSSGYFNTFLFPIALGQRLVARLFGLSTQSEALPQRRLNHALSRVFGFEGQLLGHLNMPFGLSLYAVAKTART